MLDVKPKSSREHGLHYKRNPEHYSETRTQAAPTHWSVYCSQPGSPTSPQPVEHNQEQPELHSPRARRLLNSGLNSLLTITDLPSELLLPRILKNSLNFLKEVSYQVGRRNTNLES